MALAAAAAQEGRKCSNNFRFVPNIPFILLHRYKATKSGKLKFPSPTLVLIDQLTLIPIMSSTSSFESNNINGLIAFVNAHPRHTI